MSLNIFQKSTTAPQLVQQIYGKSAANLQQIVQPYSKSTTNRFVVDLLYSKSTTNLRLIAQMEFEYNALVRTELMAITVSLVPCILH